MLRIAKAIGKPVKVDLAMKSTKRGKYARACVQIDRGLSSTLKLGGLVELLNCDWKRVDVGSGSGGGKPENKPAVNPKNSKTVQFEKVFEFGKLVTENATNPGNADSREENLHALSVKDCMKSLNEKDGGWTTVTKKGKKHVAQVGKGASKGGPLHHKPKVNPSFVKKINPAVGRACSSISLNPKTHAKGTALYPTPTSSSLGLAKPGGEASSSQWTPSVRSKYKRARPNSLQNSPVVTGGAEDAATTVVLSTSHEDGQVVMEMRPETTVSKEDGSVGSAPGI
ncbi:hypothetical protein PIB30_062218 [Stylosanthes scabra]|uniref:Uncharacterized protein n=1 Tax=Stylosanthes scabra TaxID=79078 RepID=A0ABU6QKT8_9FABA|nr:hypothetical protein [Stylosanthes scabra]